MMAIPRCPNQLLSFYSEILTSHSNRTYVVQRYWPPALCDLLIFRLVLIDFVILWIFRAVKNL